MKAERLQELCVSVGKTLGGAIEKAKTTKAGHSINDAVYACGKINGQPVMHQPWGPFKDSDEAADYFEAKRRAFGPRFYAGTLDPQADANIYCRPDFDVDIISAREFYIRHVAQTIMTCMTLLVELTRDDITEPMRELAEVPRIQV